ncbi:MAG: glycosyltransferase family 39 protein [bacterium]
MKLLRALWPKVKHKYSQQLIWVFLVAIGYILYANLGRDALFDWDEGIYAELGRQLLLTKNLFVSFWNGAAWLEKPPGISWVSALGIFLAGPSSYGARLLMPLFAVYTLYIVYRLGTHLGNWKHGLIAAGTLATFNLFLGRTRAVNTDMPLLASITTTMLFLLENRPAWWVALSIFGGVWFKGLAGLLSIIIALPILLSKSQKFILSTIVHCSLFILPWHIYAYFMYHGEFTTPYFFEQVFRRATAQIEFHFENRWYYFTYLWQNLGLGVLLVSAVGVLSLLIRRSSRYLLWWVLSPLAIFTLAKTRLFWYILPVYPALALLIAEAIGRWQKDKISRSVVAILAVGIGLQAILVTSRSVEINKLTAPLPDRLYVAQELGKLQAGTLVVLVPPSERLAEALLPSVARLTSSFRYGGMPSVPFYYRGPVEFYYDVDKFRTTWHNATTPTALIAKEDLDLLQESFSPIVTSSTYFGIQKGVYAIR